MTDSVPLLISAPGKVILHGEHAVVYGKPALAASVDLRCYMLLRPCSAPSIVLDLPDLGLLKSWPIADLIKVLEHPPGSEECVCCLRDCAGINGDELPSTGSMACLAFLYLIIHIYREKLRDITGLEFTVMATLPAGAGLGSSAAYSVCLAAGMLTHIGNIKRQGPSTSSQDEQTSYEFQHTPDSSCSDNQTTAKGAGATLCIDTTLPPEAICKKLKEWCFIEDAQNGRHVWSKEELEVVNKWGYEAEKMIHGTPSGIDNSVSTFGGAIHFKEGNISHMEKMPRLRVLLINTRVPRSTKRMVSGVRERYDKFPQVTKPILDAIEGVVKVAMETYTEIDKTSCEHHVTDSLSDVYSSLQELFQVNHHLLNALGVGHSSLDQVCEIVTQYGLSAKLTGGGGGGCAIALVPPGTHADKLSELDKDLTKIGYDSWCTVIGTMGVCQHHVTVV